MHEELQRLRNLVSIFAKEIDVKNRRLEEVEQMSNELSTSLRRTMVENDKLHQGYIEEMRKMQCIVHDRSLKFQQENEKLKWTLEAQRKELEQRAKELDRCEAQVGVERKKPTVVQENVQEKMDALIKELDEKRDETEDLITLNRTLTIKERISNHELQEARKVLVDGLRDLLTKRAAIGIKRLGSSMRNLFEMCA